TFHTLWALVKVRCKCSFTICTNIGVFTHFSNSFTSLFISTLFSDSDTIIELFHQQFFLFYLGLTPNLYYRSRQLLLSFFLVLFRTFQSSLALLKVLILILHFLFLTFQYTPYFHPFNVSYFRSLLNCLVKLRITT